MAKEIIYIDQKDDISLVINKIKKSSEKIIALVPPKQIGILQSLVNLQLLAHYAKKYNKVLVIITNQEALIRLASSVRIPIAKSLSSKPELIKVPVLSVDNDDIIDGERISVAEFAGIKEVVADTSQKSAENGSSLPVQPKIKVPNYKKFRNKIIFGSLGLILIAGGLFWAIWIAPRAEVVFHTTTKMVNVSSSVQLVDESDKMNLKENIISVQTQKQQKKRSFEFSVTGEKDLKTKATGKIIVHKTSGGADISISRGTIFKSGNGLSFITTQDAIAPKQILGELNEHIPVYVKIPVVAADFGDTYNIGPQTFSSNISKLAVKGEQMSGGQNRKIKVMTNEDLNKAKEELVKENHDNAVKELRNKFDSSIIIIDESLTIKESEIKLSSKVDEEAKDGKVALEQDIAYEISGVSRKILTDYLSQLALAESSEAKESKVRVYNSGIGNVGFHDFVVTEAGRVVRVAAQAHIGPDIAKNEIKDFIKNKRVGEIQDFYGAIEGVKEVSVSLSPFWVNKVPSDDEKTIIIIKGQDEQ